jgi:hypothetical protein
MALSIQTPAQSFVRFDEDGTFTHCIFGDYTFPLPVYEYTDIAFQFFLNGTSEEIDAICGAYGESVRVGIVAECDDPDFLVEFTGNPYNDVPEIYRLSDTQLLVNWAHGLPGFDSVRAVDECFYIRIQVGETTFCSNVLKRISDNCYTSVIDYTAEENAFGFNYCSSGAISGGDDGDACEPTIIQFTNVSTLTVPYTQSLKDRYGDVPSVQIWISDGTNLVNMGITATFDDVPVNIISADFGGPASGIMVLR